MQPTIHGIGQLQLAGGHLDREHVATGRSQFAVGCKDACVRPNIIRHRSYVGMNTPASFAIGNLTLTAKLINGIWATNGSGKSSTTGVWTGGNVPGGNPQDTAVFGTSLTSGTATVTLDGSRSLSSLSFSTTGANSYVISSSGTSMLTLANTAGSATISASGGTNTSPRPSCWGAT